MKRWLTKEYIVRRKPWTLIIEAAIDAVILTIILFLGVTKYNTEIVELLASIRADDLGVTFARLMFPLILIMVTMFKLCLYIINDRNEEVNKKKKRT